VPADVVPVDLDSLLVQVDLYHASLPTARIRLAIMALFGADIRRSVLWLGCS